MPLLLIYYGGSHCYRNTGSQALAAYCWALPPEFDSVALNLIQWGQRICISNKFLCDTDVAGLVTTPGERMAHTT